MIRHKINMLRIHRRALLMKLLMPRDAVLPPGAVESVYLSGVVCHDIDDPNGKRYAQVSVDSIWATLSVQMKSEAVRQWAQFLSDLADKVDEFNRIGGEKHDRV